MNIEAVDDADIEAQVQTQKQYDTNKHENRQLQTIHIHRPQPLNSPTYDNDLDEHILSNNLPEEASLSKERDTNQRQNETHKGHNEAEAVTQENSACNTHAQAENQINKDCGSHQKSTEKQRHNPNEESDIIQGGSQPVQDNHKRDISQNSSIVKLILKKKTKLIERRNTVLSLIITNKILLNYCLFIYKNRPVSRIILLVWFVCSVNCLAICLGNQLIPPDVYIPLQIVCTINFFLHHALFVRVGIVKELAKSFNFWFTVYNVVSFHVCLVLLYGLSWTNGLASFNSFMSLMLLLVLYDTHAAKHLVQMKISLSLGILAYVPIFIAVLIRLSNFDFEKMYDKDSGIEIMDVRLQALDNLTTIIVYLMRIFYAHVIRKKPTTIAFLSHFYEIDEQYIHKRRRDAKYEVSKLHNNQRDSLSSSMKSIRSSFGRLSKQRYNEANQEERNNKEQDRRQDNEAKQKAEIDNGDQENANNFVIEGDIVVEVDSEKHLIFGIMENKVIEYDTRNTLFHRVITKRYPLITKILKSKFYHFLGFILGILSPVFSFISAVGVNFGTLFNVTSSVISMFGVAFMVTQMITTSNITMLRHMIHSFDYWYVMFLIFRILFSSGVMCEWDTRTIFWVFSVFSLIWCIMIDTLNIKSRKASNFALLVSIWSLIMAILCKLKVGDTFARDRFFSLFGYEFMSSRINLSSSLLSVCAFGARFFWSYYTNHKRILFITENVRVESKPSPPG